MQNPQHPENQPSGSVSDASTMAAITGKYYHGLVAQGIPSAQAGFITGEYVKAIVDASTRPPPMQHYQQYFPR